MLRELERKFLDALFSSSAAPSIQRVIEATDGRSAEAAFAVYRGSVYAGLTAALSAVYPVCRKLVGQRFFDAMAERFITTTPSRSPDLTDYGGELADFVADLEPAASLPLPGGCGAARVGLASCLQRRRCVELECARVAGGR